MKSAAVAPAREQSTRPAGHPETRALWLKGAQECCEVGAVLVAEVRLQNDVVVVHDILDGCRCAIVEVGRVPREAAQDGRLEPADIPAKPGDQRSPEVSRVVKRRQDRGSSAQVRKHRRAAPGSDLVWRERY